MCKIQHDQSGFSAVEAVLVLVIVGILGFTGWYVWQAKINSDESLNSNSSTTPTYKKGMVNQNTAARLPDGWVWYQGNGFRFGYPGAYGQFSGRSTTQVAGGIQAVLTSGQPANALFPGLSTAGMLVLNNYGVTSATVQSRKYGPTVKLESGKWIVTQDNPSDPKPYKVGTTYSEVTANKKSGTMVYTFSSGDEGAVIYTLAFTAKGHLYTLQLPEFETGTYASQSPNDKKSYDQLSSQLAEHVIVQ